MALHGVKVVELPGLAPVSLCTMILADFGASVTRVDRVGAAYDYTGRGKRSVAVDMKTPEGAALVREMCRTADVVVEPFRPGVMERLGLGPDTLLEDNPRLIYARLTGWGQTGPFSAMAGHDINYLGLSGVLAKIGRAGTPPTPPANLLADFAGGSLTCAFGIVAALYERARSGRGQVIDSAMVEGAAYVGSWLPATARLPGMWGRARGENLLDTGAHFYDVYETKDGLHMAVGCLEPKFYRAMLGRLGLDEDNLPHDGEFKENKAKLREVFLSKTQAEWCAVFDGTDACVTPVLSSTAAAAHRQNAARGNWMSTGLPRPAPVLQRTPAAPAAGPVHLKAGTHTEAVLKDLGIDATRIRDLQDRRVVGRSPAKL